MNFSSKAFILELCLKIPCKGQEVREAVVGCELCSPTGICGFLSKNMSELILVIGIV